MLLIERDRLMASLNEQFRDVSEGEGHCILLCGEAGIGKTAFVKEFCKQFVGECSIYQGACDDLFTPRPLAPLLDVLWQIRKSHRPLPSTRKDRSVLFANFFQELYSKNEKSIIIFEDIHWAGEGTLDFIKFFVRRISQLHCLFILTCRDNEVNSNRYFRNVLGQLPVDSFSKITLPPLSKQAVVDMAIQKGYDGEEVYHISGGNPFYVNEILASYSPGIPEKIKNSILSVYDRQKPGTKNAWEIWSIMPDGLEVEYVPKLKSNMELSNCFAIGVIKAENGKVVFKHELYRRTIQETLTPIRSLQLNKKMLELFSTSFEERGEIERILHYAKNANEKQLVVKYAPDAAGKAASAGAHKEAAKLWLTAIEYFEGNDTSQLTNFYEAYAYECYLSNQIKEAITYTEKSITIRKERDETDIVVERISFLLQLCWIEGKIIDTEEFSIRLTDLLKVAPLSLSSKAIAYSSLFQLKMHHDANAKFIWWGEKAIDLATQSGNKKVLCSILNLVGAVKMTNSTFKTNGNAIMQRSLAIALQNFYFDEAGKAYSVLTTHAVRIKNFQFAESILKEGISYCEEKGLIFWHTFLRAFSALMALEKGNWQEATGIADELYNNENQSGIIKVIALNILSRVKMRKGENALDLLVEAKELSLVSMWSLMFIQSITAILEYEWLSGRKIIEKEDIERTSNLLQSAGSDLEKDEFLFWMKKAGRATGLKNELDIPNYTLNTERNLESSAFWKQSGCPYFQALLLFDGNEEDKRNAISMIRNLGAIAVAEKMKQTMRNLGIKNIPRGIRNSTRSNIALLTNREIEILKLMKEEFHNKEIASHLYISAKTVDHHISSILFKLDTDTRHKAVTEATRIGILK